MQTALVAKPIALRGVRALPARSRAVAPVRAMAGEKAQVGSSERPGEGSGSLPHTLAPRGLCGAPAPAAPCTLRPGSHGAPVAARDGAVSAAAGRRRPPPPPAAAGLARPPTAAPRRPLALAAAQVVQPVNGDPFVGMLETPVTSSPLIASYLSNLPAYRTGVSPLLRGVEIGLAHGFLLVGPFIKLGPLRDVEVRPAAAVGRGRGARGGACMRRPGVQIGVGGCGALRRRMLARGAAAAAGHRCS